MANLDDQQLTNICHKVYGVLHDGTWIIPYNLEKHDVDNMVEFLIMPSKDNKLGSYEEYFLYLSPNNSSSLLSKSSRAPQEKKTLAKENLEPSRTC